MSSSFQFPILMRRRLRALSVTVRPFVFFSMNVDDYVEDKRLNEGDTRAKFEKIYETKINEMIEEAKAKLTGHPKQPKLPLIRLRVINTARFG